LDLLLAPHRATTEGRAALESPRCGGITTARATFERCARSIRRGGVPHRPGQRVRDAVRGHRTAPDADALRLADVHAQQACRLDPDRAKAWAALGFLLEGTGKREDPRGARE
jgi:hypothetical protein